MGSILIPGFQQLNSKMTPERGTYKQWMYEKWADGRVKLQKRFYLTYTMYSSSVGATAYNTIDFNAAAIDTEFPFAFADIPFVTATPAAGSGALMMILGTNVTKTRMVNISYARYNTNTTSAFTAVIDVVVEGTAA